MSSGKGKGKRRRGAASSSDDDENDNEEEEEDAFARSIGYVRLDGSAGSAERRGELLTVFKDDPMTSVCLLTKTAGEKGARFIYSLASPPPKKR